MQEPDDEPEEPDDFKLEDFEEAVGKLSPEDYDRVRREALKEM